LVETAGILVKTPKGVDEIQTRANQLPQKKRYLLILVSGNMSVEDMIARFPGLGDIRQTLQELIDEGYVEARKPAGTPASAAPAQSADGQKFPEAAAKLSRRLYDLIGPTADDFTRKLEGARDRASFLAAVRSSVMMVESFSGKKKGELFQQEAMAIADKFFK
jgi:hypothetical protein